MTLKNHLAVGALFGLGAVGIDPTYLAITHSQILMLAAVIVGSIVPDIDLALTGFRHERFIDRTLLSHRGITHHVLLPVFLAVLGLVSAEPVLVAFAVGTAVHIVTDIFSPLGVPYGLKYQKRVRIPLYTTGEWSEKAFAVFVSLLITAAFFGRKLI